MIGFIALSIVLIASALFTVTAKKPVYSVIGLLANFIALAITYLTLHAEFLAVIQIVVYSGAILILFVFVIALLSSGTKAFEPGPNRIPRAIVPAVLFGLVGFAAIAIAISRTLFTPAAIVGATGEANVFGSVADFGTALFTVNLLPFEITAFVLMVAIIGVVLLAGDDAPGRRAPKRTAREPISPPRERIAR
ncbi:MAG TPA: NADH-quinone oxidoreductase subunit J [Candidatus Lustribacter sp.]